MKKLSHLDAQDRPHQVDVSAKPVTQRQATASALIRLPPACQAVLAAGGDTAKGNVFTIAQLAGIMGAKRTSDLIPLCHQIPLQGIQCHCQPTELGIQITATATCTGQTGVEMEALTTVSIAALTVYDMLKAISHDMTITDIQLQHKSGGQSGDVSRGNRA